MSDSLYTCRWGIISTGWVATRFVLDLLADPCTRDVHDVQHKVVAVGSRSKESADRFVQETWRQAAQDTSAESIKTYSSYDDLYSDPDVDCVYIGTPHSHHYANIHAALSAGKNVLCEKPLVINAAQARALVKLARSRDRFLMEALWTKCLPFVRQLRQVVDSGAIGEVRGMQSELCSDASERTRHDPEHRMVNPELAGGALLDLGPYAYTLLAVVLQPYRRSSRDSDPLPVPQVRSSMTKTSTGVDASVTATISFEQPDGRVVQGTMIAAIDRHSPPERCAVIHGSHGYITIHSPANNPRSFTVKRYKPGHPFWTAATEHEIETFPLEMPSGTWGFAYEADQVARCLRDGKLESDLVPLDETVLQMQIFDEIRSQNDLAYPAVLESLD
ncbi:hypothetical protein JCM3774_005415 [Rhodotorula dairenensis]